MRIPVLYCILRNSLKKFEYVRIYLDQQELWKKSELMKWKNNGKYLTNKMRNAEKFDISEYQSHADRYLRIAYRLKYNAMKPV